MKFLLANAETTMEDRTVVSFFFNARGADLEKSTFGIYRSLLCQLLSQQPELLPILDFLGLTLSDPERYQ